MHPYKKIFICECTCEYVCVAPLSLSLFFCVFVYEYCVYGTSVCVCLCVHEYCACGTPPVSVLDVHVEAMDKSQALCSS